MACQNFLSLLPIAQILIILAQGIIELKHSAEHQRSDRLIQNDTPFLNAGGSPARIDLTVPIVIDVGGSNIRMQGGGYAGNIVV
jgi:hypothetical protein